MRQNSPHHPFNTIRSASRSSIRCDIRNNGRTKHGQRMSSFRWYQCLAPEGR
ncbi:hypothetical protein AVEN_182376-1, partial [Araneus ventricosus]